MLDNDEERTTTSDATATQSVRPRESPTLSEAGGQLPQLRLRSVGSERLEVAAVGSFTSAHHAAIEQRLGRLVASSPRRLRVDCSQMTSFDRDAAELFAHAATKLEASGGTLEVVSLPQSKAIAS